MTASQTPAPEPGAAELQWGPTERPGGRFAGLFAGRLPRWLRDPRAGWVVAAAGFAAFVVSLLAPWYSVHYEIPDSEFSEDTVATVLDLGALVGAWLAGATVLAVVTALSLVAAPPVRPYLRAAGLAAGLMLAGTLAAHVVHNSDNPLDLGINSTIASEMTVNHSWLPGSYAALAAAVLLTAATWIAAPVPAGGWTAPLPSGSAPAADEPTPAAGEPAEAADAPEISVAPAEPFLPPEASPPR